MGSYGGMPTINNPEAMIYVSELDQQVDEQLLYELMIQAGPIRRVEFQRDYITKEHPGFGYVEYYSQQDAEYALLIFPGNVSLYNRQLKFSRNIEMKRIADIGANIFVGNIGKLNEYQITETFKRFGTIIEPISIEDNEIEKRKFCIVKYDNFQSSDKAIEIMNGQVVGGNQLKVEYAFKNKNGERFGNEFERLLMNFNK